MSVIGQIVGAFPNNDINVLVRVDGTLTKDRLRRALIEVCDSCPGLKRLIIVKPWLITTAPHIQFNVDNHLSVTDHLTTVDDTYSLLEDSNEEPMSDSMPLWKLSAYNHIPSGKCTIGFRINHAYADGYTLIKILSGVDTPLRLTKGRPSLTNIKNLVSILGQYCSVAMDLAMPRISKTPAVADEGRATLISCIPFNLQKIKAYGKRHGVTVTVVLYCIMLLSHYAVTSKTKLASVSAIRYAGSEPNSPFRILPMLFNNSSESGDAALLLRSISQNMETCKNTSYPSVIALGLKVIGNLCGEQQLRSLTAHLATKTDLIFSSVIGPRLETISKYWRIPVSHASYFMAPGPVTYSYLSVGDEIMLTVTWRGNRIADGNKYKATIENVYHELTGNEPSM
tara:strand:- start:2934 stop:4124 length:1191 start_codon:yes stop_codon:yes gene_type:complete